MIVSVDDLMIYPEFKDIDERILQRKLASLEVLVRKYTNNNFQNTHIRFSSSSSLDRINTVSPYLKVGDTIQISQSKVNDGLYVIENITDDYIEVNKQLFESEYNLVTKVEYPIDVKDGVVSLMKWEVNNRDKVGIKQESLSRHSVTYYDQDSNNTVMGYPVSLLGFLDVYKKARF